MERFEAPRLRPDWSIQSKKNRVFVSFLGLLAKKKALGDSGDGLSQGQLGKSSQGFIYL